MNFFSFQEDLYSKSAMDDDLAEAAAQAARENAGKAEHGTEKSARQIAEFSDKGHILSGEELIEHRKHCRAKPGNCPFEKAVDEADDITPNEINVTKQDVFNRLAVVLTQLFQVAKNLAKPAIADKEAVEEEVEIKESTAQDNWTIYAPVVDKAPKTTQDEAMSPDGTNEDAKIVAEIIEGGIERMVEMAKERGCIVDMDEKSTKYIVQGPSKDQQDKT